MHNLTHKQRTLRCLSCRLRKRERHLGPLLFAPYANDIAMRARGIGARRVLEIAAGTGIVTRALAAALPSADIEAADLNEAMVAFAASRVPLRR